MNHIKHMLSIMLIIFFAGGCCRSISEMTECNRANILKIKIGMTKDQVIEIMGTKSKRACYIDNAWNENIIIINNPYRSEIIKGKNKENYEILYYVTDDKNLDGAVDDFELTPLIFSKDILQGWGWKYMEEDIERYEIRVH